MACTRCRWCSWRMWCCLSSSRRCSSESVSDGALSTAAAAAAAAASTGGLPPLTGLSPAAAAAIANNPEHVARVAEAARVALAFLRAKHPGVRCVTRRGAVMPTCTFMEEETDQDERNDDRILATSVSLCQTADKDQNKPGEPRRLYREVVLLTEDRNLKVKALARDIPVREVPDLLQWAGLG